MKPKIWTGIEIAIDIELNDNEQFISLKVLDDVIINASDTLKNNFTHMKNHRELIQQRMDELTLVYSDIIGITFNKARDKLQLKEYLEHKDER